MKTKDFIKMLQEADPDGECHVRLIGEGVPTAAVPKEGYYDGSTMYINDDGKMVITDEDEKLDIYATDLESFVWERDGDLDQIVFANKDITDQRYREDAEKYAKAFKAYDDSSRAKFIEGLLLKMQDGWRIVQPASYPIGRYNGMWLIQDPDKFQEHDPKEKSCKLRLQNDNQDIMCQGECEAVIKSDLFVPRTEGELIFWELDVPCLSTPKE